MALLVTAVERTTRKPDTAASTPVSIATCLIQDGFSAVLFCAASMRALTVVTSDLRFFFSAMRRPRNQFSPTVGGGSRNSRAQSSRMASPQTIGREIPRIKPRVSHQDCAGLIFCAFGGFVQDTAHPKVE